ncbi:DUF2946 family protein [Sinorhizobium terangae]|uniref:DUF2946 family protein n=1 Tax=Sinorhizobium terangae TaxID=110322 RepID=UPI0016113BE1|nr:DUF2946 family protein [Sinorhizobium terangae]MBB4189385.1 hypothetical protein [Sinorhizobium terangae]WFU46162.1 hypothetical protein QA637_09535 [Sinorhizobium terangae]
MLKHLRSRKSIWVALVAACMLVLQAASGLAAGTKPLGLDTFGNPLCISDANHGTHDPAPSTDHSKKPDCCTLACGMFAHPAIPGRQLYVLDAPSAPPVNLPVARDGPELRQWLKEFQGSPRAPPRKA